MLGNASVIGSQEFRSNINLENYFPKEKEANKTPFNDLLKKSDIDTFTKSQSSPLEKDIKKTVKGIQEMVLAYVKGRVPLGDDKFNTTDMLRSMLDMLNATGNMQRAAMQEDGNKMALQQLYLSMCSQVGRDALIKDNKLEFKDRAIDFVVDVPEEQEGAVRVTLTNLSGEILKEWQMDEQPGIQYLRWDGLKNDGEIAEKGSYTVHAVIENEEGKSTTVPMYVPKRIEEVRFDPAKNGRLPVYYSGNQPIKQMLSVYGGDTSALPKSTVDESI